MEVNKRNSQSSTPALKCSRSTRNVLGSIKLNMAAWYVKLKLGRLDLEKLKPRIRSTTWTARRTWCSRTDRLVHRGQLYLFLSKCGLWQDHRVASLLAAMEHVEHDWIACCSVHALAKYGAPMIAHPHYMNRFSKRKYKAAFSCHKHALQMLLSSNVTLKRTACRWCNSCPPKFPHAKHRVWALQSCL